jgi:hypothetical protein
MGNADKSLTISIKGDSTSLGTATKKAAEDLNQLQSKAGQFAADFGRELRKGLLGIAATLAAELTKAITENVQIRAKANVAGVSPDLIRGGRAAFGRLGVEGAFDSSLTAVGQAQAEAIAGDDKAREAFGRYGVDYSKDLETVFRQLLKNIQELKPATEDANPLRALFGGSAQEALFAANNRAEGNLDRESGKAAFFGYRFTSWAEAAREYVTGPDAHGPTGHFLPQVTASAEAAEKLQLENRQQLLAVSRANLSVEQQIKEARDEQARLLKSTLTEADPAKRERIYGNAVQLEGKIQGLYKNRDQEADGRLNQALKSSRPEADEFAQRGLFIGGGGQSYAQQQIKELQSIRQELLTMNREQIKNWS